MTASPENPAATAAAWARPLYEQQIAMLGTLAEAALEVALDAKERVISAPDAAAAQAATVAFGRASRAVRLSLALQARLIKELEAWDRTQAWRAGCDADRAADERRARVERIVERVATRQHEDDPYEVERAVEEASERLEHEDEHGALLSRPVSEWVDLICRDLGLDPPWPVLAQEAWAKEEQASGQVGWPLVVGLGPTRSSREAATPPPGRPHHPPGTATNLEAGLGSASDPPGGDPRSSSEGRAEPGGPQISPTRPRRSTN